MIQILKSKPPTKRSGGRKQISTRNDTRKKNNNLQNAGPTAQRKSNVNRKIGDSKNKDDDEDEYQEESTSNSSSDEDFDDSQEVVETKNNRRRSTRSINKNIISEPKRSTRGAKNPSIKQEQALSNSDDDEEEVGASLKKLRGSRGKQSRSNVKKTRQRKSIKEESDDSNVEEPKEKMDILAQLPLQKRSSAVKAKQKLQNITKQLRK